MSWLQYVEILVWCSAVVRPFRPHSRWLGVHHQNEFVWTVLPHVHWMDLSQPSCLKWSYQGLAHWCCFRHRFQFKWKFHPRSEGREVETAAEFLCTTIRVWHKHKNTKYEVDHTWREVLQNLACNSPPVDPWEPLWLRTVPQSILTNDWVTVNECVCNRRTNLVVKKK